jgi:hypothetical protein
MTDALKIVGNWNDRIEVTLASALAASIEITGRSGKEACDHAIILMAKSSRNKTPQGKSKRPVNDNPDFRHLLKKPQYKTVRMSGKSMPDYYRFTADKLRQPASGKRVQVLFANERTRIAKIGNVGLAKRSWTWGLSQRLGKPEIAGIAERIELVGDKLCGIILRNKLSYLLSIMPSGWEQSVQSSATNVIMAQAAKRLEREFGIEIPRAASKQRPATTLTAEWSAAT